MIINESLNESMNPLYNLLMLYEFDEIEINMNNLFKFESLCLEEFNWIILYH